MESPNFTINLLPPISQTNVFVFAPEPQATRDTISRAFEHPYYYAPSPSPEDRSIYLTILPISFVRPFIFLPSHRFMCRFTIHCPLRELRLMPLTLCKVPMRPKVTEHMPPIALRLDRFLPHVRYQTANASLPSRDLSSLACVFFAHLDQHMPVRNPLSYHSIGHPIYPLNAFNSCQITHPSTYSQPLFQTHPLRFETSRTQ